MSKGRYLENRLHTLHVNFKTTLPRDSCEQKQTSGELPCMMDPDSTCPVLEVGGGLPPGNGHADEPFQNKQAVPVLDTAQMSTHRYTTNCS